MHLKIVLRHIVLLASLTWASGACGQRFFNLTAAEVVVDSVLPEFTYSIPLYGNYDDSLYTAEILYPEFVDMTSRDMAAYKQLAGTDTLPEMPIVTQRIAIERKKPNLEILFCPLVRRDGRYRILVSFMLKLTATAKKHDARMAVPATRAETERYTGTSVLATGKWAKIRVPATGIYRITESLIRKAGFSSLDKIKVYGYGGNLQEEKLNANTLIATDDLKEVATYDSGSAGKMFYACGPVSWSSKTTPQRIRNPYSDYGYYFITEDGTEPLTSDSAKFMAACYPAYDDWHDLYEKDGYAWFHGGRNLYDPQVIAPGKQHKVIIAKPEMATKATLGVNISAGAAAVVQVSVGDSVVGNVTISIPSKYYKGNEAMGKFTIPTPNDKDTIIITNTSTTDIRTDYISVTWNKPHNAPKLDVSLPEAEYVYNITNQNLHADKCLDMVIIIPTSQKLREQAERLAEFHRQHDGMKVKVVPADELYNEFSSGTPDANAYRRYMKMLYDRAETEADMPKYLLLFGDCVWDNRMLTTDCRKLSADDYLLVFESENSFSETTCYADDGFFCMLDDGEGGNLLSSDRPDIAVGRFPVTDVTDAKTMVDKTIAYAENKNAGSWLNTVVFMGDDGDNNVHMRDINDVADQTSNNHPGYLIKKIMWDAYPQETSATGNSYPAVVNLIKKQQAEGALVFDYGGHGRPDQISHENVLRLTDFINFSNKNLPLWITASCDIVPYDGVEPTIGEAALTNPNGGAWAFFGTARTVFVPQNKVMNSTFMKYVLSYDDNGKPTTVGEAQRLTKCQLISSSTDKTANKLQFQLLGDPAVALKLPTEQIVIDSINGIDLSSAQELPMLKAGSIVNVSGYVKDRTDFNGLVTMTVRDSRELVTCNMNASAEANTPFKFYDYTKMLFNGSDSIRNGRFNICFSVPMDINYSDEQGLMNFHAVNKDRSVMAHGHCSAFTVGGTAELDNDSIGPSVFCYLNSPTFANGGNVNPTPYFVAQITDANGINTTGNGIGHDLQLIIDGKMEKTYNLNDNFVYDFGTYTSGTTYYNIPELEEGRHTLKFKAWDILNNSTTTTLDFNVVKGLRPNLMSVAVSHNPATTSTTFIINHDRTGGKMDVDIEVFDTSGRILWKHSESGVSTGNAYTIDWNLMTDNGKQLQTGVYLYRARIACDGSSKASKANKLIVVSNK